MLLLDRSVSLCESNSWRGIQMKQCVPLSPAILSIIGWHAKESPKDIVSRKRKDIAKVGRTIWFYQSWKARVTDVQHFGSIYPNPTIYFLEGSPKDAITEHEARLMSHDGSRWEALPNGIGKVTGKVPGGGFLIGELSPVFDHEIDLWEYYEHPALQPLKFQLGASTACVVPTQKGPVEGMKSRRRQVVAIGRLAPPYAIFLR
jgi:hypothetical protein